ncbi:shikimate kinase [Paenarthrobacter sp. DKR-5]|uniref:shikimate kinase n=1 Tax=Paenarthrobacter sp. DKR-5 TaxID=2835535 RepID=UPI001BDC6D93|nr:shikimate kinase [Paenarthrobacter sp. DKR-5]MBT1003726.1 shikimate kinase [Paenarthrobacter sp. DKR-5]
MPAALSPDFRSGIPPRPIVLIGPMAVGKSALGEALARALGVAFVDTDQVVVERHGPIPELFVSRGERFFREEEARAVAQVLETHRGEEIVVSLGGGAVLDSGTQQLLRSCTVVFLEADLATVFERINRSTGRPLLAGNAAERWQHMADMRWPVYQRLADVTLDVRGGGVEDLVRQLRSALDGHAEALRAKGAGPRDMQQNTLTKEQA